MSLVIHYLKLADYYLKKWRPKDDNGRLIKEEVGLLLAIIPRLELYYQSIRK